MTSQPPDNRAIRFLDRTGHWLSISTGSICVFLFAAMVVVTLMGVFFRYVVRDPLQWSEELARFLLLWTGFLAMNVAMHHRQHLSIDALVKVLPARTEKILGYITDLLIAYFLLILTVKGYQMTVKTMMKASSMNFSMFWIYMSVPLGALLTLIQLALKLGVKVLSDFSGVLNKSTTTQ